MSCGASRGEHEDRRGSAFSTDGLENLDSIRERKLNPSDVEDEAARAIADLPYVERTYTRTQLMHRQAMASLVDDYVARSFFPARGPDLFVIFKPYWLFGKEGTSHGTRGTTTRMFHFYSSVPVFIPARTQSASASQTSLPHSLRYCTSKPRPAVSATSSRRLSPPLGFRRV